MVLLRSRCQASWADTKTWHQLVLSLARSQARRSIEPATNLNWDCGYSFTCVVTGTSHFPLQCDVIASFSSCVWLSWSGLSNVTSVISCVGITFLTPQLSHTCVYHLTCSSVSFCVWHRDACPCDSEGGETVTHANASRQLCVCLLAISCLLGHWDIGSCPLWFLSLELGEDLTLRLPDTETSSNPVQALWPQNQEIKIFHKRKVMKNTPTITQSWSNVHCAITDDWCNWHCITNLTYSTVADDSFPADELKTLEILNSGKGDLRLI